MLLQDANQGHLLIAFKVYDVQKLRAGLTVENSLHQLQQATLNLLPEEYHELLTQEYALLLQKASLYSREEEFTSKHAQTIHEMSANMVYQYGKQLSDTCMEYITDIGFALAYDGMKYRLEHTKQYVQLGASLIAAAGQAGAQQAATKLTALADTCGSNADYQSYFQIMQRWCGEGSPRNARSSYKDEVWSCGFLWME